MATNSVVIPWHRLASKIYSRDIVQKDAAMEDEKFRATVHDSGRASSVQSVTVDMAGN